MDKVPNPEPKLLRDVAGGFATGVTVISVEKLDGSVTCMTANSFVSVSLDPPLVMFSVKDNAHFLEHCSEGDAVGISILSAEQKPISSHFARMGHQDLVVEFELREGFHCIKNALGWYHTIVKKIISAGDHQLILCTVLSLGRDRSKDPLLYYNGYRIIGKSID